jgi:hypothetical protein
MACIVQMFVEKAAMKLFHPMIEFDFGTMYP